MGFLAKFEKAKILSLNEKSYDHIEIELKRQIFDLLTKSFSSFYLLVEKGTAKKFHFKEVGDLTTRASLSKPHKHSIGNSGMMYEVLPKYF